MADFLIISGLLLIFYAYFGYPFVLLILTWLNPVGKKAKVIRQLDSNVHENCEKPQTASILIAARNEVKAIQKKLENTLTLSFGSGTVESERVQIVVASDASDDGMDEIVASFAARGVQLVKLSERGGKDRALRAAAEVATGEILLCTDAQVSLNQDALSNTIEYFRDPTVGCVSSVDRIEDSVEAGSQLNDGPKKASGGEGLYLKYEMWLRQLESEFGTLVGLSGSCFAIRKELATEIRHEVPSDFAILLAARRRGLRGVQAKDVVGTYGGVASEKAEFERKVRTVLRGMTTLFSTPEVLNFKSYGSFAWQVASHKVARWLVPLFLAMVTLGGLTGTSILAWFAMLGTFLLPVAALAAVVSPSYREKFFYRAALFFLVVNAAIAVAWVRYLSGVRQTTWTPTAR